MLLANVAFRESSVSDKCVFGKFGKSFCGLSCPQGWMTRGRLKGKDA